MLTFSNCTWQQPLSSDNFGKEQKKKKKKNQTHWYLTYRKHNRIPILGKEDVYDVRLIYIDFLLSFKYL